MLVLYSVGRQDLLQVFRRGKYVGSKLNEESNSTSSIVELEDEYIFVRTNGKRKISRLMPTCMSVVGQVSNGRDDQFSRSEYTMHKEQDMYEALCAQNIQRSQPVPGRYNALPDKMRRYCWCSWLFLTTTVENNLRNEQQTGCTYGLVAVYLLPSWSFFYNPILDLLHLYNVLLAVVNEKIHYSINPAFYIDRFFKAPYNLPECFDTNVSEHPVCNDSQSIQMRKFMQDSLQNVIHASQLAASHRLFKPPNGFSPNDFEESWQSW
ncbi:hypothetical protein KSF78_0006729 [Schistosoma japonicum]|nr:hypothetical protein KSF78_0006729 [Schistosoma japonicum]